MQAKLIWGMLIWSDRTSCKDDIPALCSAYSIPHPERLKLVNHKEGDVLGYGINQLPSIDKKDIANIKALKKYHTDWFLLGETK
jgi:hypothetical protein